MKCQKGKCNKPAVVHITEIVDKKVHELHFCEDCAKEYLAQVDTSTAAPSLTGLAGSLAEQLKVEQTAKELAELDAKTCSVCGITFSEFRNQGRLGCPNDYVEFEQELDTLLWNIHGANKHVGKSPRRGPNDTRERTELIRLRREMKEAILSEEYERASQLRDKIKRIEQQGAAKAD